MSMPTMIITHLVFSCGQCTGVELLTPIADSVSYRHEYFSLNVLDRNGLLSVMDRMVLGQLAARVDQITRKLDEATAS